MAATTAPRGALEGPLIPSPRIAAGLLGCAAIALAVRSLGLETVFPSEGVVLLSLSDAHFYARLALFAFVNFPEPLTFDRFIAWPDGAVVPAPPGFGLAIAGMARLFGDSVSTFERVAAWVSPFAGALTTLPVYAIGRRVASPGTGLGAAALFAVLPASTSTSSIGNVDHHATVALLGACWIASSISQVRPATAGRLALRALRHAALVAALLFTWSGSLLYLALGEGARLAAWAATGRGPRPLVAQTAAALVASVAVVPWIAAAPVPLDGPLATTTLSWFHVVMLTVIAGTCGALA
ncbi:MAG: glycosyltransferase family 39 protein, partial [Proteobacteria bacterium]|nr:glycosyltransferase family 39 protein [Pseudomonadota bacterium]